MLFTEQNTNLKKQLNYTENNRIESKANVFLKDGIKHKILHSYQCSSGHSPPR